MTGSKRSKERGFSIFRSAGEEADMKSAKANWDNEGGHMSSTAGEVVRTPGSELPYKAVLTLESGETTERAFATMQEAEAFIRRNTPRPPARSTTYSHEGE